ncbi:NAD(P)/FAD-dependent oxidoreductase [Branchiibius sp. NY16-3462-2]|uniref:phytoene desaturase family protein n=1 Tax=Branchiibius sp. NY16-3462-2 TaxID=1807500 RepID=UPI000796922E|nr:NAD(P)/FAD-dependent oxidoreductase [Branchiibius sp. NY16-3462-2]KYH45710.1 FAD-dependent oxidoreductase [Branchiibius sp. NY16-3462-2]
MTSHDPARAVVVGSGPNGLAAAIRLAQAGLEVTVVEGYQRVGGGMRTEERTVAGLLHDVCSAFHPTGVASPYFQSLDLERHGLHWRWPQIDLAHPLDDGRAGVAARDLDVTRESLEIDGDRWARIFEPLVRQFDGLVEDVFQPVIHRPRHPLVLGRFGVGALLPATVAARAFSDDPAKALFTGVAAHAFDDLRGPLTSAVGLLLTTAAHAVGWPVAEGGSESIARALAAELQERGGRIITGAPISRLDQLEQYTDRRPDIVILDVAPAGALRIAGDRLPGRVRRAFEAYRYGPGAFKVDYAIEGDIPWTNALVRRAGTVHLGGRAQDIVAAEALTTRGRMPDRPFVLLGQQYLADPGRSGNGINPIYAYAHVPQGYSGDAQEHVTRQIERFAPGFRDQIIASTTVDAAQWEAYNPNYVGGDIGAGANTARQLVFRPRATTNPYSLGVPGLYLCSAATPPGGGVHGMAGFHAAEAALAELSRSAARADRPG